MNPLHSSPEAEDDSSRDESGSEGSDSGSDPADASLLRRFERLAAVVAQPADSMAAKPPDSPRYRFRSFLARGGMGEVWRARDTELNRDVAVKILRAKLGGSPEQFRSEAELSARLEHPGIVPIYDAGVLSDGRPFFAMKLIQGRLRDAGATGPPPTLADLLSRRASPAEDLFEYVGIFQKACEAVAYAHALTPPVLHRDLKPSNIMAGGFGEVLVMDWGIAKILLADSPPVLNDSDLKRADNDERDTASDLGAESTRTGIYTTPDETETVEPESRPDTRTGDAKGTVAYMPPEQARGEKTSLGPAADVFGLGGVLCAILTGKPPYTGATVAAYERAKAGDLTDAYARLDSTGADPALLAIAKKCLAAEPADRFADAAEVVRAVADYRTSIEDRLRQAELDKVRIDAERLQSQMMAGEERRRRRLQLNLGGGIVLVLLAGTSVAAWLAQRATKAEADTGAQLELTREAERTANRERENAQQSLRQSQITSANLALERGRLLGEQGKSAEGLLWFIRGMELAPADEEPLHSVLRANLSAFREDVSALQLRLEHTGAVNSAALSRDGTTILSGTTMGHAWLWDATTGRPIGEPLPHPGVVEAVALSPDGKTALTGCIGDANLRIWNVHSQSVEILPTQHKGPICAVAFHPEGKIIATGSRDGTAQLWDLAARKPIGQVIKHEKRLTTVAFRPDGEVLLTVGLDTKLGMVLRRSKSTTGESAGPDIKYPAIVFSAAWSPDGSKILVGDSKNEAQLLDVAEGKPIGEPLAHDGMLRSVAFSPDGQSIATGGEDTAARIWDPKTGKLLGELIRHPRPIYTAAFSADGGKLLTACNDLCVRVWGIGRRRVHASTPVLDAAVKQLPGVPVLSPDGRFAAFTSLRGNVQIVDVRSGRSIGPVRPTGGSLGGLAFSPDGKRILVGTGTKPHHAQLYNAETWEKIGSALPHLGPVNLTAFAAHGRLHLTAEMTSKPIPNAAKADPQVQTSGTAHIWDAATGKSVGQPLSHKTNLTAIAGSPDGKIIVTGSLEQKARVWEIATGTTLAELPHESAVAQIVFSPDGRILATASESTVRIWHTHDWSAAAPPLRHPAIVHRLAFSPDGQIIVTSGADRTARLWDVRTGLPIGPALRHPNQVRSAVFTADQKGIVSVSQDGVLRTWTAPTRLEGSLEQLTLWVETMTGLELDRNGEVRFLDTQSLQRKHESLKALGGPPRN